MQTLAEVRGDFPDYADLSDAALADALHSKFYADMPREQFDEKIGLKPDKYQQAAIDEQAKLKAAGVDTGGGVLRRAIQGATFNAADDILAGLETPLEMVRQGTFDPREGYKYAKAREDQILSDSRKSTGALGTAAEIAGGVGSGVGLARAGFTAARLLPSAPGLFGRTLASAADAAGLGGFAGFNEGNTIAERTGNAGTGAVLGGVIGGAVPPALAVARGVTAPIVSNIMARANPEAYARSQVARAIAESGRPVQSIADDVSNAANEGQGVFTLADAMGNPGQRMLSTVARAPGPGRTDVVNFLENRQGGQGRRVSNALIEGFDTPQTAAQTEARMTAARGAAADAEYGAVRSDAKPVDVSNVIARIDDTLSPGVNQIANPGSNIANDSVESALASIRNRLTDGRSNLTDFTAVQRVRGDLSDMVESARRSGAGNKARLLGQALRELDNSMEAASAGHRQANANFAQASRDIDAIQTGRDAAMRGRTEDTIPAFRTLSGRGQQAFRAGYVDPLVAQTQGAAFGVNKARPLLNDAFQQEAAAVAPMRTQALMQRRLGREQTMFETRGQALGGSKTADNLADADAMAVDPTLVGNILSGNYAGAIKSAIQAGSRAMTGSTPEVRQAVANILLQRGTAVTPASLDAMVGETIRRIQSVETLARTLGRGGSGGLAVTKTARKKR